jgi:hypothetical protein
MNEYIILGRWWLTSADAHMGVVARETDGHEQDETKRTWKATIGVCKGFSVKGDEQHIAAWGAALTEQQARGFFPEITRTYKGSKP